MRTYLRNWLWKGRLSAERGMTRPRYPHPWLARAAKAGVYFGLSVGTALAVTVLLPTGTTAASPFESWLDTWEKANSARKAWAAACNQVEGIIGIGGALIGWLLAAGLLRLVATGRIGTRGPVHGLVQAAHFPALVGIGLGLLVGVIGTVRWIDPRVVVGDGFPVTSRFGNAVELGQKFYFPYEHSLLDEMQRVWRSGGSPTKTPLNKAWRMASAIGSELYVLFLCIRSAGVMVFLSGVVYCLSRLDPDAET